MVFVNLIWIDWTHVLWSHGTLSSPFSTEETWTTLLLLLFQIFHRNQGRAQWLAGYVGLVRFNKGRVAQPAQPGQAPALFSLIEGWHSPVFWRVAGQHATRDPQHGQCTMCWGEETGGWAAASWALFLPAARPGLSRHLCIVRLWSPQHN